MQNFRVFVVEDDDLYAELLAYHLRLNPEYEVHVFHNAKSFLSSLYLNPDAITLDYSLPDSNGETVLKKVRNAQPDTPVIIISGQEDIATAVKLLREGAYDYIVKDEEATTRLWNSLRNIREQASLKQEISHLREEIGRKYVFSKSIIGKSESMQAVFRLMEKALPTNITVSITGETGTGKDLVAKAIHYNSKRKQENFVAVNVAAIPKELIESELFGHEKGAFTGAITRRIGCFEQAHKGTIFLDEIGEMEMSLQAKLLRVLQERELVRIGGQETVKIDTRVIVATHRDLANLVKTGKFRQDLYYRLLGLPIHVPPLRERGKDILLLAKFFIEEFCRENQLDKMTLSAGAQKQLLSYHYPGNVRELKAVIELAAVMSNEGQIEAEHINFSSVETGGSLLDKEMTLKEYNREIIRHYLKKYQKNVLKVADKLEVGKSTIYRMLQQGEL